MALALRTPAIFCFALLLAGAATPPVQAATAVQDDASSDDDLRRVGAPPSPAAAPLAPDVEKAAFVYRFGGYVEWPEDAFATPASPLVIGVVGADALADTLANLAAGRHVDGRPVQVRKLAHGAPLFGLHVVFIGDAGNVRVAEALDAIRGQPALTITDSADGLRLGSMVNFVVEATP